MDTSAQCNQPRADNFRLLVRAESTHLDLYLCNLCAFFIFAVVVGSFPVKTVSVKCMFVFSFFVQFRTSIVPRQVGGGKVVVYGQGSASVFRYVSCMFRCSGEQCDQNSDFENKTVEQNVYICPELRFLSVIQPDPWFKHCH